MNLVRYFYVLIYILFFAVVDVYAVNLHLLDEEENGFQIYRSGRPSIGDLKKWCDLGITEAFFLSGDYNKFRKAIATHCPQLKVVLNQHQKAGVAVDSTFLKSFDLWVENARKTGKKILFRCNCGCHRAGRLSAYYEMKYMDKTYRQALEGLYRYGRNMHKYDHLLGQLLALEDFARGRKCQFTGVKGAKRFCVRKD